MKARLRSGFTLVEILVVIVILSLLVAIATPAIFSARGKAARTGVLLEINTLETAVASHQTQHNFAPTDFGQADATARANLFVSALRRRWPRTTFTNYADLQAYIASIYTAAAGYPKDLDIDDLDQAEALVFWLGGMPEFPGGGSTRLRGFSANVSDPFIYGGSRSPSLFAFDDTRLTDADGDGWLEYVPSMKVDAEPAPPFVYFDASNYTSHRQTTDPVTYLSYPSTVHPGATPTGMNGAWGSAVPYAASVSASNTITWHLPKKFQIIAAGEDGAYSSAGYPGSSPRVAPVGANFNNGDTNNDVGDWDNLSNLFDETIRAKNEAE